MVIRVALVVDTGVDDALALIVAARHPALQLRGVMATAGNVPIEQAVGNTRYVLDLLSRADMPVAVGANRRLDGSRFRPRPAHGPDGLAGLAAPPADRRYDPVAPHDVVFVADVVVSLGPLTPLMAALGRRVVASYARPGEANYEQDPFAGHRWSGIVEHGPVSAPVSGADLTGFDEQESPLADLTAGLLRHQAARGAGLGDATVVLALAEPELPAEQYTRRLLDLVRGASPDQ